MTKTQKVIYYIVLVLVSALFIFAGFAKLAAQASEKLAFTTAHLPIWFMYFIGVAEIFGAIGLWIRSLQKLAVWGLGIIMIGAIVVTLMSSMPITFFSPLITLLLLICIRHLGKKRV